MKASIFLTALLAAFAAADEVPEFGVVGGTDRRPLSYEAPGTVKFVFSARKDGAPTDAWVVWTVKRDGAETLFGRGFAKAGEPLVVEAEAAEPGFLVATAGLERPEATETDAVAASSAPKRPPAVACVGAGASVGKLRTVEEPVDFDEFWAEVRAEAAAADPEKALTVALEDSVPAGTAPDAGRGSFSFELPVREGVPPAVGHVVFPKTTSGARLPLVVAFTGYDENDPRPTLRHPLWGLPNAIVAHVTTHGFPMGRDGSFYSRALDAVSSGGVGGAYGFRNKENDDPHTCYFRAMVVRDLAALKFLETLPQWDGKTVVAVGAHLGAWRAAAAAALGGGITGLAVWNPWLCDLGGAEKFGRARGWLPEWRPALGYYDGVAFARRIEVPCFVAEAPLASTTSPPAGAALFHAALRGPKKIEWKQGLVRGSRRIPENEARAAVSAVRELAGEAK